MKNYTVFLKSIVDVKNFVDIVNNFDFVITLESDGTSVNAKSMMSVLSLNLTKPVLVTAFSDDSIKEEINDFMI